MIPPKNCSVVMTEEDFRRAEQRQRAKSLAGANGGKLVKYPKDWRIGLNVTPSYNEHPRYPQRGVVVQTAPSKLTNKKPTIEDLLTIHMETGEIVQERAMYWRPLT